MQKMGTKEQLKQKKKEQIKDIVIYSSIYVYISSVGREVVNWTVVKCKFNEWAISSGRPRGNFHDFRRPINRYFASYCRRNCDS